MLRVMGRPPDLHQQGQHRMAKATVTRDRRALVKVLAQGTRHGARLADAQHCGPGGTPVKRRLHVTIFWQGTKRDDPNMLQDLKADIDGLVDAGWLVDDKREWLVIDYPPEYVYAVNKKDISVEYRLYEAEA